MADSETTNLRLDEIDRKISTIFEKLDRHLTVEREVAVLRAELEICKKVLWGTVALSSTSFVGLGGSIIMYLLNK